MNKQKAKINMKTTQMAEFVSDERREKMYAVSSNKRNILHGRYNS